MKFNHKKYTYQKPFTFHRHRWEIVGAKGGVHFDASIDEKDEHNKTCGLEFHFAEPPSFMKEQAPGHVNCWLTGGRCWHDGTSLYAVETLWPMYKMFLEENNHEAIFKSLEREYKERFD